MKENNEKQLLINILIETQKEGLKNNLVCTVYRKYPVVTILPEDYIEEELKSIVLNNDLDLETFEDEDYENFVLLYIKDGEVLKSLKFSQFKDDLSINYEVFEEDLEFFMPFIEETIGRKL